MKVLVTGACGFVGSRLIARWREQSPSVTFIGIDNLCRPGSELNQAPLREMGVALTVGDLRDRATVEALPAADAVIDAAALPSVLGGIDGRSTSRDVVEHNLVSTINLLEYCRSHRAAFVLLSTSRVYSLDALTALPMREAGEAFVLDDSHGLPEGVSTRGVRETFPARPPMSLYGATKLASETLAIEYGGLYDFPVWINRCGLLAGPGQFGQPEQGIVSYWIHSWMLGRPLKYLGFGGTGRQVRDALDPADLLPLIQRQLQHRGPAPCRVVNVSGGADHAFALAELSSWCARRFGPREVGRVVEGRRLDVPWLVLDCEKAAQTWGWRPVTPLHDLFEQTARFAEANPRWLDRSIG